MIRDCAWRALRGVPRLEARRRFVAFAWRRCPELWQKVEQEGASGEKRAEALAAVIDARMATVGPAIMAIPLSMLLFLRRRWRVIIPGALVYVAGMKLGIPLRALELLCHAQPALESCLGSWRIETRVPLKAVRCMRIVRMITWALLRHMIPRVKTHPALNSPLE